MEYPTRLLHFSELPHWLQDNPSILTSYRPPSYSIPASLRSIFTLHNETVNIATHLFGALLFLLLPLVGLELSSFRTLVSLHGLAPPSYDPAAFRLTWLFASPADAAPFVPFFVGAVICLATSTLFHATSNVSPHVARLGNQLDYVGIACMIAGSTVSSVWFGFVCQPRLQTVYAGMILLLGLGCTVVSLDVRFRTPSWRPFRAGMFIAMGLSGAVPFFHAVRLMGWAETQGRMGAGWAIAQGAMYILGAGLYAVCPAKHPSARITRMKTG
jgi:adiponectin receptor